MEKRSRNTLIIIIIIIITAQCRNVLRREPMGVATTVAKSFKKVKMMR